MLREGLQRQPGIGELRYSLGLLLAEQQRPPEAALALEQAARLLPQRARAQYNLGLAASSWARPRRPRRPCRRHANWPPADPAIAYALAVFYAQQGGGTDARGRSAALQPGNLRWQRSCCSVCSDMGLDAGRSACTHSGRRQQPPLRAFSASAPGGTCRGLMLRRSPLRDDALWCSPGVAR